MKTMTWTTRGLFISNGISCSTMTRVMDRSRDFFTASLSCLSPDGSLVAVRDLADGVVRVRRVVHGEWRVGDVLFSCQQLPPAPVLGFAWSPSLELLAVQLADGSVYVYQVKGGRGVRSRQGQQRGVYRLGVPLQQFRPMVFSPSGKRIALSTQSGVVLWEPMTNKLIRGIGTGLVESIAWSLDGRFLTVGGDSSLAVFQIRPRRLLQEWTGHTAAVSAIAWSPDGERMITGDRDGNMLLWNISGDPSSWSEIGPVELTIEAEIEALAWSPRGHAFAVVDAQDHLDTFPVNI